MAEKGKIIVLDFIEDDHDGAIEFINSMHHANSLAGLIFALALKHDRKRTELFGATGRMATNQREAIGLATMLQFRLAYSDLTD